MSIPTALFRQKAAGSSREGNTQAQLPATNMEAKRLLARE
jgi:hypothetical protein